MTAANDHSGDEELVRRALQAQARAYAPYSRYPVGAAVATADGTVVPGANVENASYGLSVCAERNAILRAVADGAREIAAVAVVTPSSPPAAPCGACLQTMLEFAPDPRRVRVILANPAGERTAHTLAELAPFGFGPADLERRGG
jgi:cytidine deaminase